MWTYTSNAKLAPRGRHQLVLYVLERGAKFREAGQAFGVDTKTVRRWVQRFLVEGPEGLYDRSSRPHQPRGQTPRAVRRRVARLRRQDRLIMDELARREGISRATVARILADEGLSRLSDLDPKPPVRRYEHTRPGSMIHLDIKKLGRFERPESPAGRGLKPPSAERCRDGKPPSRRDNVQQMGGRPR